jgi:hypothetical protein
MAVLGRTFFQIQSMGKKTTALSPHTNEKATEIARLPQSVMSPDVPTAKYLS